MTTDLDLLEADIAACDPKPEARVWESTRKRRHAGVITDTVSQAIALVRTWRAMPALISELRALREVAAAAESLVDELSEHATGCGGEYGIGYRCYCYAEMRDHLRAALAKVPR